MAEEPSFHQFHHQQVAEQQGGQDKEKEDRRRHETEVNTDRSERQKNGHRHHGQRTYYKPMIGAAFEGVSTSSDDEDYQHLRGHRLDEPAGMEKRLSCMTNRQHNVEGQEIED